MEATHGTRLHDHRDRSRRVTLRDVINHMTHMEQRLSNRIDVVDTKLTNRIDAVDAKPRGSGRLDLFYHHCSEGAHAGLNSG